MGTLVKTLVVVFCAGLFHVGGADCYADTFSHSYPTTNVSLPSKKGPPTAQYQSVLFNDPASAKEAKEKAVEAFHDAGIIIQKISEIMEFKGNSGGEYYFQLNYIAKTGGVKTQYYESPTASLEQTDRLLTRMKRMLEKDVNFLNEPKVEGSPGNYYFWMKYSATYGTPMVSEKNFYSDQSGKYRFLTELIRAEIPIVFEGRSAVHYIDIDGAVQ